MICTDSYSDVVLSRRFAIAAVLGLALAAVPGGAAALAAVPGGAPVGFASVNALGQNGTTGGVGGPQVTVSTTDALLDAIDTVGPLVILVSGTIYISS